VHRREFNGKTVKYGRTGILRDGYHLLKAAVLEGVTLETFVVRGIDNAVSIGLGVNGIVTLEALLKAEGYVHQISRRPAVIARGDQAGRRPRNHRPNMRVAALSKDGQCTLITERYPSFIRSAERYGGRSLSNCLSPSLVVARHAVLAMDDEAAADRFFDELRLEHGELGHPAQIVRDASTERGLRQNRWHKEVQRNVLRLAFRMAKNGKRLSRTAMMNVVSDTEASLCAAKRH
jgi:hypothetical protein